MNLPIIYAINRDMDKTEYQQALADTHKTWIKRALLAYEGSQVKAARWLGITRMTLRARIKRYNVQT